MSNVITTTLRKLAFLHNIEILRFLLSFQKSQSSYLLTLNQVSCDGRVVKALDLKSNGVSPRRFESCLQRLFIFVDSIAVSAELPWFVFFQHSKSPRLHRLMSPGLVHQWDKLFRHIVQQFQCKHTFVLFWGHTILRQNPPRKAVMAERLRRWTRNPMGFPRAGSNPAYSDRSLLKM